MEDPLMPLTQLEGDEWGCMHAPSSSSSSSSSVAAAAAAAEAAGSAQEIDPWGVWGDLAEAEAAAACSNITAYCCYEELLSLLQQQQQQQLQQQQQQQQQQMTADTVLPYSFPSVLLTATLTDTRTPPWHAAKLAALLLLLQQKQQQQQQQGVYLRCLLSGQGHYGELEQQQEMKAAAEFVCFLLCHIS